MARGRRIVITGISGHWAGELARRLERDRSVEFLAGIDTQPPAADLEEAETYFDNSARRRSEVACCMLRFQPEIGPGLDAPLVRYLSLPVVPTQLGFDPRLQLLHAEDATGALLTAVHKPVRGPVNVAPSGTVSLTKTLRLAGRPT